MASVGSESHENWIRELVYSESTNRGLKRPVDPVSLIDEATISFLKELRALSLEASHHFNQLAQAEENGLSPIKLFPLAQSESEFMLFRNQMKLMFASPTHGVIQVSFAQHGKSPLNLQQGEHLMDHLGTEPLLDAQSALTLSHPQEFMANLGPFREVSWTFQGEKVEAEAIVRFYFTEFARASRSQKKVRPEKQMLLDQIKALLEEKGL